MKYKDSEVTIKDLKFKVTFLDSDIMEDLNEECELFKVVVTNTLNNKSMVYRNFKNSVMEKRISDYINLYSHMGIKSFKAFMHKQMWGGYDKVRNFKELELKRVFYLQYSVINDFSFYINFSDYYLNFEDFALEMGYSEDSRKAEKIYKDCLEMEKKIRDLALTDEQEKFFIDKVRSEEDEFKNTLLKQIGVTDD